MNIIDWSTGHGGLPIKESYTSFERLLSFVEITRPFLLLMAPLLAGAGAVIALGGYPPLDKIIWGVLAVVIATSGIHTFNDFIDRKRDLKAWPLRPIPAGRMKSSVALLYALSLFAVCLLISVIFFNITTFIVFFIALLSGVLYCSFLRDKIGYLSLPPIVGLFPVGGWVAFSPETLFIDLSPWYLFLLAVFWQSGHIMVHSPGHPVEDRDNEMKTEKPALFFTPSPKVAAVLGLVFLLLTLTLSAWLFFSTILSYVYLLMACFGGILAVGVTIVLINAPNNKRKSLWAFNIASLYNMFLFGGILLDILVLRTLLPYFKRFGSYLYVHYELIPLVFITLTLLATVFVCIVVILVTLSLVFLYSKEKV